MPIITSPMAVATLPVDVEKKRLQVLKSLAIMDTTVDQLYDDITRVAAALSDSSAALITFIDEDRVWFKSRVGNNLSQVSRCDSFCQYTIAGNDVLEVEDTLEHEVFRDSPFVNGEPHWRYYVGVPLAVDGSVNVGTLCLLNTKPSKLNEAQLHTLRFLANTVVHLVTLRRSFFDLNSTQQLLSVLQEINEDFIKSPENKKELFTKMLNYVLKMTGSEYGFIGEVFDNEGKEALRTYAITDISWNDETRALYKKYEDKGMLFTNHNTLFGYTLRTGESVIANDPVGDPRKGGIPHGHPPLSSYMGIALKDHKGSLIGMVGLANRKEGYEQSDMAYLQPFISMCCTMIISLRSIQLRLDIEDENKRILQKLQSAQLLAKLGAWEYYPETNEMIWSDELYRIYEIPMNGRVLNYREYHDRIHPDDVERNDGLIGAALAKGKDFTYEERILLPEGRVKTVVVNGSPIFNEAGEISSLQGTMQDITLQKRKELELQRFFDLAVDFFCIASAEGFFLQLSNSFRVALGFSELEMKTLPFVDFVHPEDRERTLEEVGFMVRGGTSRNFENRYRTKEGGYLILGWTAFFDEETKQIFATAEDITNKKDSERVLLERQVEVEKAKAKDIFLANMSHEIRTPLNAIIGFNDILRQTQLSEEQRKNVDFIGSASKTLSVLINDILDISKLESGKLDLEHAPFKIEEVARKVVQMHSARTKTKGVKMLFSFDQEIPAVLVGDETRMTQILVNLISNAIKFTEKGSVELRIIELERTEENVSVAFEIRDTGIGIDKDKLDLIFERFTQAETYTTRVYGGTGLGLSIVRSLVELQHGHLEVESELGVGSVFRFSLTFPIANEQEIQSLNGSKEEVNHNRLADMSILLVEDNEHNQILAETYLLKNKAIVDIASNGKIALGMVRKKTYDVILMDIQMPIMDGITATEAMRNELGVKTPIIACSAHAMASERAKCKEVGMNDYITKPYTEDILITALSKYRNHVKKRILSDADDFAEVIATLERNISKTYAEKIIGIFKQRLPDEIQLLEQAIEERDFKLLEERAHYQSGSMSSLHFKHGYQLSHAAERAAAECNSETAGPCAQKLVVYLKDLLHFLNTPLKESRR